MRSVQSIDQCDAVSTSNVVSSGPRDQPLLKRLALKELHDQVTDVGRRRRLADVIDGADVRVLKRCDRSRFTPETLARGRRVSQRRRQYFERHIPFETHVPRTVDLAHAARADLGGHFIRAEAGAWSERHTTWLGL